MRSLVVAIKLLAGVDHDPWSRWSAHAIARLAPKQSVYLHPRRICQVPRTLPYNEREWGMHAPQVLHARATRTTGRARALRRSACETGTLIFAPRSRREKGVIITTGGFWWMKRDPHRPVFGAADTPSPPPPVRSPSRRRRLLKASFLPAPPQYHLRDKGLPVTSSSVDPDPLQAANSSKFGESRRKLIDTALLDGHHR